MRNNLTAAEAVLWRHLKNNQQGVKFRRQHGIANFIVDFYCTELNLAVEVDGRIHHELNTKIYDEQRENVLKGLNVEVLRFENEEIYKSEERVLEELKEKIKEIRSCKLPPPPSGTPPSQEES